MAIANAKLDAISQFIVDEENDGELNGDDIDEEIEHRTEGWVKYQNIENAIEVSDDCRPRVGPPPMLFNTPQFEFPYNPPRLESTPIKIFLNATQIRSTETLSTPGRGLSTQCLAK